MIFQLSTILLNEAEAISFWQLAEGNIPFWLAILLQLFIASFLAVIIQENVKKGFNNNLEKVRAELMLNSQLINSWKMQEREALIQLHTALIDHYYFLTGFTENAFIFKSYREMTTIIERINDSIAEINKSFRHLCLFVTDEKMKLLINEYFKVSGYYYSELAPFFFECYKYQSKELPNGLDVSKAVLTAQELGVLENLKKRIVIFLETITIPYDNEARLLLDQLSSQVQEKIKSIQF